MTKFTSVEDIDNLNHWVEEALAVKHNPFIFKYLGENKTLGLIFMNPSLRTRLSTQRAALNLGMSVIVMNVTSEGWQLETQEGAIMNGEKAEHIKDAVAVMGQYCQIIGIRTFAQLQNREEDYEEKILNQFIKYAGVPIISLESATLHPLQSFADLLTIYEYKTVPRPKIVLSWAAHPKALPQAVPNSFAQWIGKAGYELVITQPEGYELDESFTHGAKIEYDQRKAFEGAHFIYAKNWSSYRDYGKTPYQKNDWIIDQEKMQLTDNAYFMHCLPVRRNVIVSDEVIDGNRSLILPQAANRVWAAQTVLKKMLEVHHK